MDNSAMTTFQIISIIISIATLLGLGTVATMFWKDLHGKKQKQIDQRSEEHQLAEKEKRKEEISEILEPFESRLNTRLDSIDRRIDEIDNSLTADQEATVLELRVHMKQMRDACKSGKELDTSDIATWKELYRKYYLMGGNHFQEYVDGWGKDIGISSEELRDIRNSVR